MIYPSVTQLKKRARKDYNYWGIFSTLLILLCWNLGLIVGCIQFEVGVAKYNRSVSGNKELGAGARSSILDYIDMMNGFGATVLSLVILHL
jgi:hypothetical protein